MLELLGPKHKLNYDLKYLMRRMVRLTTEVLAGKKNRARIWMAEKIIQ